MKFVQHPVVLKDLTSTELHDALAPLGVSPHLARQLQVAAVRRDQIPVSLPAVSARLLERVGRVVRLPRLDMISKVVSPQDGFAKYLFSGDGPELFEVSSCHGATGHPRLDPDRRVQYP